MRILLATSELHPYSKTGGLGDMVGALAKYLAKKGHQVGVVTPLYRGIREKFPEIKRFEWLLAFQLGTEFVRGGVWTIQPQENLTVYFIDQPRFFDRDGIYQGSTGDFVDNAERFTFFCKSIVNLARYLPLQPEIVHLHDWQTGLVPLLIRHDFETGGWGDPPLHCLTVHNLAYQGVFEASKFALCNLPWEYFTAAAAEFLGSFNFLKAGICIADQVTTVSPTYASEIVTPEFGCGLEAVLSELRNPVKGILNGVDYEEWNTRQNPHLMQPYDSGHMDGKRANKLALQKQLGLSERADAPLFVNVSRLVEQKGADLQLEAIQWLLDLDVQFALLGKGDALFEEGFSMLAAKHPGKVAVTIGYDHALAHRLEAGGDFFVMPSRFEPCGLNQMYSLRYGTPPIVRDTGGLADSVTDARDDAGKVNGIKFREPRSAALKQALFKALAVYHDQPVLGRLRRNGMRADFAWEHVATHYETLYREMKKRPRPALPKPEVDRSA